MLAAVRLDFTGAAEPKGCEANKRNGKGTASYFGHTKPADGGLNQVASVLGLPFLRGSDRLNLQSGNVGKITKIAG